MERLEKLGLQRGQWAGLGLVIFFYWHGVNTWWQLVTLFVGVYLYYKLYTWARGWIEDKSGITNMHVLFILHMLSLVMVSGLVAYAWYAFG